MQAFLSLKCKTAAEGKFITQNAVMQLIKKKNERRQPRILSLIVSENFTKKAERRNYTKKKLLWLNFLYVRNNFCLPFEIREICAPLSIINP